MKLDLPQVSRTLRINTKSKVHIPFTNCPTWLHFLTAAKELAGAFPDLDQREIEQLLFEGEPLITDEFIYVPQTVILNLLGSAIRHGLIEPPAGLPEELWEPA
ncbi:MAG: hypothetical protein ACJ71W_05865 [Terriglobales bacterium]